MVGTAALTLFLISLAAWVLPLIGALHHQVSALRAARKLSRLRRVPVLTCDVLRQIRSFDAIVAVQVRTTSEVIQAPKSGLDCGWYNVKETEHAESNVGEPVTDTWHAGPSAIRAGDDTGTVFISPRLGRRRLTWRSQRLVTTSVSKFTEVHRREREFDGRKIQGYSVRERIAPTDTPVFVIGALAKHGDDSIRLDRVRGWTGTFVGDLAELRQIFAVRPDAAARRAHRLVITCWITFGTCAVSLLGVAVLNYLLTH